MSSANGHADTIRGLLEMSSIQRDYEQGEAALVALDALLAENQRYEKALTAIHETARWYADNGNRLALEVDHALCVEVLSAAREALAGDGE